jgi:hypothetical protein
LQSTDWVNLSDVDNCTEALQRLTAALANFPIAADDDFFPAKHHVSRSLQTVLRSINKYLIKQEEDWSERENEKMQTCQ